MIEESFHVEKEKCKIQLVIVLFNIEKIAADLDLEIKQFMLTFKQSCVTLIDNGSTDSTKSIVGDWVKNSPRVSSYFILKNRGYGSAIKDFCFHHTLDCDYFAVSHGNLKYSIRQTFSAWNQINYYDGFLVKRINRNLKDALFSYMLATLAAMITKNSVIPANGASRCVRKDILHRFPWQDAPDNYTFDLWFEIEFKKASDKIEVIRMKELDKIHFSSWSGKGLKSRIRVIMQYIELLWNMR